MGEDGARLYLAMSGEHPTLPFSEATAILDAYKVAYHVSNRRFKLVELQAPVNAAELVARRAAYVDEAGVEIFQSVPEMSEIAKTLRSSNMSDYIRPEDSFNIRVARYGGVSKELSRVKLEAELGGLVASQTGSKVDLETPMKRFRGILTESSFHFGLQTYHRPKGSIGNRRPRKRPVFHPSTMIPKLARCLVNLSGATEETVFLDPFCGVGGIVIEAGLLGCPVIGIDALRKMLRGTRRNLSHFGLTSDLLVRGDARHLPLRIVDAIATDPPYGTGASTLKATTREILRDFLPGARAILPNGSRAVVVSPLGTETSGLAEDSGFKIVGKHHVYVHRSLTREILVLLAN